MTGNCFGMANSTVDLCVTKQKLDRAEVAVLFQALRFGVVARSSTLGMICPPTHPPSPFTSTALAVGLYRQWQGQLSEAYWPSLDRSEPNLTFAATQLRFAHDHFTQQQYPHFGTFE